VLLTVRSITIDRMVNKSLPETPPAARTAAVSRVVGLYVGVTLGTLVALTVISAVAPGLAPREAWGHEVVVAVFAGLLCVRVRAARRGSDRALRAVGVITAVLCLANIVEATVPGFPSWMRVEMAATAALMLWAWLLTRADRAGRADPAGRDR
jgi:hypothetical protein